MIKSISSVLPSKVWNEPKFVKHLLQSLTTRWKATAQIQYQMCLIESSIKCILLGNIQRMPMWMQEKFRLIYVPLAHNPPNPHPISKRYIYLLSRQFSSWMLHLCLLGLILPLHTKIDSILNQFCLCLRLCWKKKADVNFLFLEPCERWSFPWLSLNTFYLFPFLSLGQGWAWRRWGPATFFSFCPQIYTHIHEIGSEILDQKICWFRDLRAHRIVMKEHSLSQESSCMVAQQSKFGRRKSIVIVLSPVLGTFSTLSHSLSKELWGVIIRN